MNTQYSPDTANPLKRRRKLVHKNFATGENNNYLSVDNQIAAQLSVTFRDCPLPADTSREAWTNFHASQITIW